MKPHVSMITLGVDDVSRAKRFYGEGLKWPIVQDYNEWVAFALGDGSSGLGLLPREMIADDAGVAAAPSTAQSVTLSHIVGSSERVDAILAEAKRAGGAIVKPGAPGPWGGYFGYFSDPDGYLWKVATGPGPQPFAAE